MGQSLLSAAWVLFFVFVFVFPKKTKIFIWLRRIPVATCGVFSCSMWDLASPPGVGLGLPDGESGVPATGPPEKRPHPAAWLGWQPGRWSPGKPFWGLSLLPGPVLLQLCYHLGLVSTDGLVSADGLASADGSAQRAWPA